MVNNLVKEGTPLFHKKSELGKGSSLGANYSQESKSTYIDVTFQNEVKQFAYPSSIGKFLFFSESDRDIDQTKLLSQEPYKSCHASQEELALRKTLSERKIQKLLHFTRAENLPSIMANGLVPISLHTSKGISCARNDLLRIDAKEHYTSFSIEFPNYRLFWHFRQLYPEASWVIITLSIKLLLEKRSILYCPTNAARVLPQTKNENRLSTLRAFSDMFLDSLGSNEEIRRSNLNIPDCWTTDPQAEILIDGIIEPRWIESIVFSSVDDLNSFRKTASVENVNMTVQQGLFRPRPDYIHWQRSS